MDFNRALQRCALKGWPDRRAGIDNAARVQELFLHIRLNDLVRREGSGTLTWDSYTDTAKVHARLQEGWSDEEEQALRLSESTYHPMQSEIEKLQAIADPAALDGPYEMAKRDPELISAGNRLRDYSRPGQRIGFGDLVIARPKAVTGDSQLRGNLRLSLVYRSLTATRGQERSLGKHERPPEGGQSGRARLA